MTEWKDITSYSQGQRGKVEPSTWELKGKILNIVVTRRIYLEGWFLDCRELNINYEELGDVTIERAQELALMNSYQKLEDLKRDLNNLELSICKY